VLIGICLVRVSIRSYYHGHTRFTNRVTASLGIRELTTMRANCKLNGVSDALPLAEIFLVLY